MTKDGGEFLEDAIRQVLQATAEIKGYRADLLDANGPLARLSSQVTDLRGTLEQHTRQYNFNWGMLQGEIQGIRSEMVSQGTSLGGLEGQVLLLKQQLTDVLLRLGLLEAGPKQLGIKVPNGVIRVLLVEDVVELRCTLEKVLLKNGMRVKAVGTLEAARSELVSGDMEVVLADLKLPDGSGMELLEAIRSTEASVEVIVMSAMELEDFAQDALQQGAYGVLEKPFRSLDQLVVMVQRAAERRRLLVFKNRVGAAQAGPPTSPPG